MTVADSAIHSATKAYETAPSRSIAQFAAAVALPPWPAMPAAGRVFTPGRGSLHQLRPRHCRPCPPRWRGSGWPLRLRGCQQLWPACALGSKPRCCGAVARRGPLWLSRQQPWPALREVYCERSAAPGSREDGDRKRGQIMRIRLHCKLPHAPRCRDEADLRCNVDPRTLQLSQLLPQALRMWVLLTLTTP